MLLFETPLFETITQFDSPPKSLAKRRFGVIETQAGQLSAIHVRPYPQVCSLRELWPIGDRYHAKGTEDRCWLYYNQPLRASRFLALRYVVSTKGTSYATFRAAIRSLDWLAAHKGVDALVCDAANSRLSERFMRRQGWEPHAPMPWRRNFIRRFYGDYPSHTGLAPQ